VNPKKLLGKSISVAGHILRRGCKAGYCPICEGRTLFFKEGVWLRDQLRCIRCNSIPRFRALIQVLQTQFPEWRSLKIHESSPGGASSKKIAREANGYVGTHYFPDVELGTVHNGFRCEDLERQTFPDASFDLVVTQDVFEHVLNPAKGFSEICRTLKPGGAHIFTVPWYPGQETFTRAVRDGAGIRHLATPEFHGNPIDPGGSLVVTDWGSDLFETIDRAGPTTTTVNKLEDVSRGIEGKFLEVFISRKRA
jgi:SAM-dependent methyltransferase